MNTFWSLLLFLTFKFILSAPVYFETKFLKDGDPRFLVHHYVELEDRYSPNANNLRFWLLVPKLGVDFKDGFVCRKGGLDQVKLDFLKVGDDETLTELANFTDTRTWGAVFLTLWGPTGLFHRFYFHERFGVHLKKLHYPANLDELVDHVFNNATQTKVKDLLGKGLPTHVFSFKVLKKFGLGLE